MDQKAKILDIAMNLNRIGNWAADDFEAKRPRIDLFLEQTSNYLQSFNRSTLSEKFGKTYEEFISEYKNLKEEGLKGPADTTLWAEKMMTWGNILTHRANLV